MNEKTKENGLLKIKKFVVVLTAFSSLSFYIGTIYFFYLFRSKTELVGIPQDHILLKFIKDLQSDMNLIFLVISALLMFFAYYATHVFMTKNKVKRK